MRSESTHWGTDGELHCGSLDLCAEGCCEERRHLVIERPAAR